MVKLRYRIPMNLVRSFRRLRIGLIIPGILKSKWRRGRTLVIERSTRHRRGSISKPDEQLARRERPRGTKRKDQSPLSENVRPAQSNPEKEVKQKEEEEEEKEKVSPRTVIRALRRRHHSAEEEGASKQKDFSVIFTPQRLRRGRSTPSIQGFIVEEMVAGLVGVEKKKSQDCLTVKEQVEEEDSPGSKERKVCSRKAYIQMIKARGCFGKPKVKRSPPGSPL